MNKIKLSGYSMSVLDNATKSVKNEAVRGLLTYALSNDNITKHISPYSRLSGSSTEVAPISVWKDGIYLEMGCSQNWFANSIKSLKKKLCPIVFSDIYFVKSDGSCPNQIRFIFSVSSAENIRFFNGEPRRF